ncbi:fibronectin type III domain-containing protein [Paenibacillus mesotrionivorans]|uniref:Fibronectin type III domain-containing protein n=1 Tax=Paenibacillus mesotrionivorans TaxID=3160968 RepID=A0ACC7P5F8_9BACL
MVPETSSPNNTISEEITPNVIPLIDSNSSSEFVFPFPTPESNVTQATYRDVNVEALKIPRPRTELTDKRDRFSKTFLNPDGTTTVQSAVYSLHYLDKGAWKEINTTLRQDRSDGKNTYSMLANRFNIRLNDQSSKQSVTFSVSDQSVTYRSLSMKNVTGVVYDNTVIYNEVWKSTDLEYQVQNDQLKMELQLKDNKAPKTFSFQIDAQNVTYDLNPDGSIDFMNQNGEVAFRIPRMWVKDSTSDTLMYDRLKVSLNQLKGKNILTVTLDDTGLQYPVTIDPTTEIPTFGQNHWLFLKSDGTVLAWGDNQYGQVGDGTTETRPGPVPVAGLTNVRSVYIGNGNSYAIKQDGTVWAWGRNNNGQLGNGSKVAKLIPTQVNGLTNVTSLAVNTDHVLALKEDGTVWAWGRNLYSELGNGKWDTSLIPVQSIGLDNIKAIAASYMASMALKKDGTVWVWGYASPSGMLPLQLQGISNIIDISAGHTFYAVLKADGSVWAWGNNDEGQIDIAGRSWIDMPIQVIGLDNVKDISLGHSHTLALKSNGTIWSWGANDFGQLGNGTTSFSYTPIQINDLSNVRLIQTSAYTNRSFAILDDNTMWMWGGDSTVYNTLPVLYTVPGLGPDTIPPSTPSAFTFTNYSVNEISFHWQASTDNIGVVAYDIYLDNNVIKTVDSQLKECTINGLVTNVLYNFSIKARDAAGNSSVASSLSVYTDTISPTAPSNLKITNPNPTSASLSWDPSTDNFGVSHYTIDVRDSMGNLIATNLRTTNGSITNYTVTDLNPDLVYFFNVFAIDTSGNISNPSVIERSILIDQEAPTKPTLSMTNRTSTSISISWTASTDAFGIKAYDIYHEATLLATVAGNITSHQIIVASLPLDPKTTFKLSVKARDGAGNVSTASNVIITNTDLTAPSAPTNFRIVDQIPGSVSLSWNASSDEFGVTNYEIYASNRMGLPSRLLTTNGATSFIVTGLPPSIKYEINVKAIDFAGNKSVPSNSVSAQGSEYPPTIPKNLTAKVKTESSIYLSWDSSSDENGIIDYEIYNGSTLLVNSNSSNYTLTGLQANTTYVLSVRAKDGVGYFSGLSSAVTVTTDVTPPTTPGLLRALSSIGKNISLIWDASIDNLGVVGYEIYSGNSLIATSSGTGTSYTLSGMAVNKTYTLSIKAKDAAGNLSLASNTITVITDDVAPTAPKQLKVVPLNETSLSLSWIGSMDYYGIAAYEIYNGSEYLTTSVGTATTFTLTGLKANTVYSLSIKARDAAGNLSDASNVVLSGTDLSVPTPPNSFKATGCTATSISLSWAPSYDNVGVAGYNIYHGTVLIATSSGTGTTYTISGLTEDTFYSLTVKAWDAAGNLSIPSQTLVVSTDGKAPTAPQDLEVSQKTDSNVTLIWKPSTDNIGIASYDIYNGTTFLAFAGTATTYTFKFAKNTIYNLTVKARDAAGNISTASNIVTINTDVSYPTEPYGLTVLNRTETTIDLSWEASTDNFEVVGYKIFAKINDVRTLLATSMGKDTKYLLTGLKPNTMHILYIAAFDAAGNESVWSNPVHVSTDLTPPTAPTSLSAHIINQKNVKLTWTASTDNVEVIGYDIYLGSQFVESANVIAGQTVVEAVITGLTPSLQYSFSVKAKDAAGNIASSEILLTLRQEYIYDKAGRLSATRIVPVGYIIDYRYDKNGNLLKKVTTNSLLMDSSFEKGGDYWYFYSPNTTLDSTKVTEGKNSIKFSSSTPLNKKTIVQDTQLIEVSPNTTYTLSAMIQDNLSSGSFYVSVKEVEPNMATWEYGVMLSSTKKGQQVWDQPSIQFTTHSATVRLRIEITADSNAVGEAYIDQIVLQ